MGNAEQAITRQWVRLGWGLPLSRLLGMYYTHVGYYVNQCTLNRALIAFCFMAAFFTLMPALSSATAGAGVTIARTYFSALYVLFLIATMLPLLLETWVEEGLRKCFGTLGRNLYSLGPIFAAFQSKLMA